MRRRAAAAAAAALIAAVGLAATSIPGDAAPLESRQIGSSVGGKPIMAYRLGDPSSTRKALVVGAIHGDEAAGLKITDVLERSYADIEGVDLWVVESANPDGVARGTRVNAHGVDLNRNWPHRWRPGKRDGYFPGPNPFSEPESRAMRDFIAEIQPAVSIWFHQPWNAVLAPCRGPAPLQRRYAKIARMKTSCRGAKLHGTAIQWQNATFPGTAAIVVELRAGKLPRDLARRNARAIAAIAAPVGP